MTAAMGAKCVALLEGPSLPEHPPPSLRGKQCSGLTAQRARMGDGCSSTVRQTITSAFRKMCDLIQTSDKRSTLPL